MKDILLSIIIPVYNAEMHLDRTLKQLCNQIEKRSFFDVKLIVLDDASTDSSTSIIAKYKDKRFVETFSFIERVSTGKVRNIGLDLACQLSSEYVAFCDSDDLLDIGIARNMALNLKQDKCPLGMAYYQKK